MTDNDDQKRGSSDNNNQPQRQPANADHAPTNASYSAADNDSRSSLASRIQNSASGLARSAFSPSASSSSADAAQFLAGANGSKAGPSASSSAALSATQRLEESGAPAPSSSAREHLGQNAAGETFRSSSTANQQSGGFTLPAFSEQEFQTSYGGDALADLNPGISNSDLKGKGTLNQLDPSTRNLPPFTETNLDYEHPTAAAGPAGPLPTDGAEVASLLSSHTFDPEFPPLPNEPFEPIETDLSATSHLTSSELQAIDSFLVQTKPHRLTPYSLVPDIDTVLNSAATNTDTDATALRDDVLSKIPLSSDWITLDERYHDEVWGYLRPALEAAKAEVEAKAKSEDGDKAGEEGPAVRRLKMILKHMGG